MSENHWFDDLQDEDFLSWASTFEEVQESGCDTALFCIGAIEQHSYHMPLGTDWLLGLSGSRLLARELAERGLKSISCRRYLSAPPASSSTTRAR